MKTKTNLLQNPLDIELAKKIIYLFLQKQKINEPIKLPIKNLSEEKYKVVLSQQKKQLIITLKLVIQGELIKYPAKGGFPTIYYQYVEEINFSSEEENVVVKIQENFVDFCKKTPELQLEIISATGPKTTKRLVAFL